MPFVTPPPERRDGALEWAWNSVPHVKHLVSGDALFVEDGRTDGSVMFLLIDVEHHGEEAAFVVELFRRFYLWDDSTQNQQPLDLLMALTSLIAPHYAGRGRSIPIKRGRAAAKDRFTAALAVLIDPASGQVSLAIAGIPPPYVLDRDGARGRRLPLRGLFLGIAEIPPTSGVATLFGTRKIVLDQDKRLLAMTDGILEARPKRPPGRPLAPDFKTARLRPTLAELRGPDPPAKQVAGLFRDVKAYVGRGWPADDSTAVLWRMLTASPRRTRKGKKIKKP
jgi:hypothetical protein